MILLAISRRVRPASPSETAERRRSPSFRRARRTCSGRASTRVRRRRRRSLASTSSGEAPSAKTTALRRSPKSKGSSRAACRASCWRRSTKRRWWAGEDAVRAKIPVVIFDSGLKGGDYVSFVATDNRQGGRMAAEGWRRCCRRAEDRDAALCRRVGEHGGARRRVSGRDRQAPGYPGPQLQPVRRRRRRRRVQTGRGDAPSSSAVRTGRSISTGSSRRTSRIRSRCCACCSRADGRAK